MASKVSIVNRALTHLGNTKYIGNIETERSTEAITARQVYDNTFAEALREFNWPFARRIANLGLVSEDTSSTAVWRYTYRYPSGCVKVHRLIPSSATYTYPHIIRLEYEISSDSAGRLILTNQASARIEYTAEITDTSILTPDFTNALSYLLAFVMAPAVTTGDPYKLGPQAFQMYQKLIRDAEVQATYEEQAFVATSDQTSEFSRARD